MKQNRTQRLVVAGILFLLVIGPLFTDGVSLLVDWLWFKAEGYQILYKNVLLAQIGLSGMAGIGFIVFVGVNVLVARAVAERYGYRVYRGGMIDMPSLDRFAELFRGMVWVGVLLVGYAVGQWASIHWQDYLLAKHAVPMGETDPLF